jgi:hypothetical protein
MKQFIFYSFLQLLFSASHCLSDNKPSTNQVPLDVPRSANSEESEMKSLISSKHEFAFSDPRMIENQNAYEQMIMEKILVDLENSTNVTKSIAKYPQNSEINVIVEGKYAYHILIDTDSIQLFVYNFDLALESCGPYPQHLKIVHKAEIKGNIFELRSIPNKKYRVIIEQLLTDSSHIIKGTNQEIPLFITIHPALTFLPAVIIEDTLENIRVDFMSLHTKFCRDCPNIISYDEYAYLTWYNKGLHEEDELLEEKPDVINIGFHPKCISLAYPLSLSPKTTDDDKIVKHRYCKQRAIYDDSFIQNAYFEKSPEKVGSDLLYYNIKQATEKANPNSKVEIQYPCYPKYYSEKIENIVIKGSGNFKECKSEIKKFLKKYDIRSETPQIFGIPNYKMPWPLETLKENNPLREATINIDSSLISSFVKSYDVESNFRVTTISQLSKEVESQCTQFLTQDTDPDLAAKEKKEELNKCFYILYSLSLLEQAGLDGKKEVQLKAPEKINEAWISGLTITNIETFYDLEYQWFLQTQQNVVDRYSSSLKERTQQDKRHALNVTFGIIMFLMVIFWMAFIIRYRKLEENDTRDSNKIK